jgi:hypothetical protein
MSATNRIPTHIDYGHRMAEIAAEMAGYSLDELRDWGMRRDDGKSRLYRSFLRKGFAAVNILGPAVVDWETPTGEKVPDAVRHAGNAQGLHALTTVRQWRGLSIEQLAQASGLSPDLIASIEASEIIANEMHENALGKALNVTPHAITDWRVNPGR